VNVFEVAGVMGDDVLLQAESASCPRPTAAPAAAIFKKSILFIVGSPYPHSPAKMIAGWRTSIP
jgi:hypothetical protein